MKKLIFTLTALVVLIVAGAFILKAVLSNNNMEEKENLNQESTDGNVSGNSEATDLIIKTLKEGAGDGAKKGDSITVDYTGIFEDGTQFDSSVGKEPLTFILGEGNVIEGWDLGLIGMKPGEVRQLTIPYDLAYGEAGYGPIPPKATLIFEVELISVN
jgi:peptidylprolyl isomerase/FKBP-type peptidyl-prolyl cis-trans isomerase FkpA